MELNVIKELQTLEMMVLNWKNDYLSMKTSGGGNEFLADEFHEEITTHVSPFVRRLCQNNHLSFSEAHEFLGVCYNHVEHLRRSLIEGI